MIMRSARRMEGGRAAVPKSPTKSRRVLAMIPEMALTGLANLARSARIEEMSPASRTALRPAVAVARKTMTPRKGSATAMTAQPLSLLSAGYMEAMRKPKRSMRVISRSETTVRAEVGEVDGR